jgi:hypothetical protein
MFRVLSFNAAGRMVSDTREYFNLCPTPIDEECTQCGIGQEQDNIVECEVYARQLVRIHGEPPAGCELFIMQNLHDFGYYYEVNVFFDPTKEECEAYAQAVEQQPEHWDDEAKAELIDREHPLHVAKIIKLKTA